MNICFIGGGNMAKALIGGLIKRGYAPSRMRVVEIDTQRCSDLHNEFAVRATTDMSEAVGHCETVVLAVKPQQLRTVSLQLSLLLKEQLVISIAAGIRAQDISRWLDTQNIVRAMPNTPALIRHGATGLYALPAVKELERTCRGDLGGGRQHPVGGRGITAGCSDGDLWQRSRLCVLFHRGDAAGRA